MTVRSGDGQLRYYYQKNLNKLKKSGIKGDCILIIDNAVCFCSKCSEKYEEELVNPVSCECEKQCNCKCVCDTKRSFMYGGGGKWGDGNSNWICYCKCLCNCICVPVTRKQFRLDLEALLKVKKAEKHKLLNEQNNKRRILEKQNKI